MLKGKLAEVLGQERAINHLLDAELSKRLPSSWIFFGPSGIGKKMAALGFVQRLVCDQKNITEIEGACGVCSACQRIAVEQSENLLMVSASDSSKSTQIKIDQIREIVRFTSLVGGGSARAIIIDNAEKLNPAASNALLKTLEEPPENTYFFLITSSLSSLLPTIRSRAQVLRFDGLTSENLGKICPNVESWIIDNADGSVEQVEVLTDGDWFELRKKALFSIESIMFSAKHPFLDTIKDLSKDKESVLFSVRIYQKFLRDVFRFRAYSDVDLQKQDDSVNKEEGSLVRKVAQLPAEGLSVLWANLNQLEKDTKGNIERGLSFENYFLLWAEVCRGNY